MSEIDIKFHEEDQYHTNWEVVSAILVFHPKSNSHLVKLRHCGLSVAQAQLGWELSSPCYYPAIPFFVCCYIFMAKYY